MTGCCLAPRSDDGTVIRHEQSAGRRLAPTRRPSENRTRWTSRSACETDRMTGARPTGLCRGTETPSVPDEIRRDGRCGGVADHESDYAGTSDEDEAPDSPLDELWQKFLDDNERAIQASAPRELSALERKATDPWPPLQVNAAPRRTAPTRASAAGASRDEARPLDAVGELWQPEGPRPRLAWGDMDREERLRRVGRALGAAAAVVVLLGMASYLPPSSGNPTGRTADADSSQTEDVPDVGSTDTAFPHGPALVDAPSPASRVG